METFFFDFLILISDLIVIVFFSSARTIMQFNALIISREYNMTSHNGKTLTATIKDGHILYR